MNPIQDLISFITAVAVILYFLVVGRYIRRITHAVEKIAGMKLSRIVVCENCRKEINLGVGFMDQSVNCPRCNAKVKIKTQIPEASN
jgi:uncharacterized CHY-type Zn-finger protein